MCVCVEWLVGMQRILVPGQRKGRGVQRGLVRLLSGLTVTAPTVFLARLYHHLRVSCCPQTLRRREQFKQRMIGSTCSASLRTKPLSQVKLLSGLKALVRF